MTPLGERPRDRLKAVTIDLLSDRTLPNILLGAALTALLQYLVGLVPLLFTAATTIAWLTSILVYTYVDRVKRAIEEQKRKTGSSNPHDYLAPPVNCGV